MALEEMNNTTCGSGNWGIVIFFLILFWVFTGGFCGNNRFNNGYGCNNYQTDATALGMASLLQSEGAMGRVKHFDLERQATENCGAVTTAIHNMQDHIASTISAGNERLAQQSRLQYDAQQGEKMFDLKLNTLAQQNRYETQQALQAQNYEAKLMAKDATIERMTLAQKMTEQFHALEKQIAEISCNMLVKPNVTGVGAVCPNAGILNGLGISNSLSNCCGIA